MNIGGSIGAEVKIRSSPIYYDTVPCLRQCRHGVQRFRDAGRSTLPAAISFSRQTSALDSTWTCYFVYCNARGLS